VCEAVARALDALFPDRPHAVRLLDPATLALTAICHTGTLRPGARGTVVLRREAVAAERLPARALAAAGAVLADADAPIFEGSGAALAAPLAVPGALHGIVNVEYPPGAAVPASDAPVLAQLASTAALGIRTLRSLEALASMTGRWEDLVEHANALIAVVGRDHAVTVWNGALARLTGVAPAAALGRDLASFAPAGEAAALSALVERTLSTGPLDGQEARLVAAGGGEARVVFNTAPVRGPAGEVEGVVAIGEDTSRLRSLEAAAEQAEKMAGLGRLASGIVHELNNPLTAVTMYADALHEKWAHGGGNPADLDKLKAIKDAGQRILKLARDLTTYARPSAARPEPVELQALLDQAALMCKPAFKEAGATVQRDYRPAPQVSGVRAALIQCFVNLVANAAQAVAPGGTVRLGLGPGPGGAVVTVADDGAGMAPDVLARAFEPFFTTRSGRGIGLGLPIARGIVERHGGAIAVESEAGRGTTVTVTLPVRG
jgi:PAS domain S-box-containing protein